MLGIGRAISTKNTAPSHGGGSREPTEGWKVPLLGLSSHNLAQSPKLVDDIARSTMYD